MDNNTDFYKKFDSTVSKNNHTIANIFISFICGILGSLLVFGLVFGIPSIKNSLVSNNNSAIVSTSPIKSSNNTGTIDTISLSNYSDTAIYASSKVLPSIVGITVEYNVTSNSIFFGQSQSTAKAEGSGIIISKDGYILTNNHIINSTDSSNFYQVSEATSVKVSLYGDETTYDAKIIGSDSQTDLAIIKIDKTDLTIAELGDSDSVKIGEFVLAIGNPLGVGTSVSSGIVSAVNREVESENKTYTLIQTDSAINSGNSGGALVNSKGQVIGINTLKVSGSGIEGMGFAIPINATIDVYKQLIQNGKVLRPYIGIAGIDLDEETAKKYNYPIGVYVKSIENFSSAEKSGIKVGDVITSIDGNNITTMEELNKIKTTKNIGDSVILGIYREKENIQVTLTLGEEP